MNRVPGFHGRAEELAWLRGLWDACTKRDPASDRFTGGPRAACIVACHWRDRERASGRDGASSVAAGD